tara:strand:- start:9 stop:296 length:288 start_codon:yes stop_codon:yes gene_type:complete
MTKQLEKVLQAIDGLSNDEINQVAERCSLRRTYLNKLNIRQFRIGDKVKFTPNKRGYASEIVGTVQKLGQKYVTLKDDNSVSRWRVPANHLQAVA